jgi:hypothetical protein
VAGSTGVTINVAAGASVSASHSSAVPFPILTVQQNSTITNNGTLSLSGGAGSGTNRGAAMLGNTNGNTLTNNGTISTSGTFNDGMAANGNGNTLINNGTITTAGPNAYGMTAAWGQTNTGQLNNMLINTGSVTTSGSSARAASILGGSGTINNSGTLAERRCWGHHSGDDLETLCGAGEPADENDQGRVRRHRNRSSIEPGCGFPPRPSSGIQELDQGDAAFGINSETDQPSPRTPPPPPGRPVTLGVCQRHPI